MSIKRKLASIQIIDNLQPIEGADFIEVASVLGWKCVAKKGEFSIGDKCIYIETDSIVPDIPFFEFMRERKFRVKTIKLRKQISQGLVVPLSLLDSNNYDVGDDVTEKLGIKKYEPEEHENVSGGTKSKGSRPWPSAIPKTDEIRIQSIPKILDEMRGMEYYITQKQDGCSATYTYDWSGIFHVCSRNRSIPEFVKRKRSWKERLFATPWKPWIKYVTKSNIDNLWWEIALKYNLKEKLMDFSYIKYSIQGEICGPKLKGNKLCLSGSELFVFNVYDWTQGKYLDFGEALIITRALGLKFVPILERGINFDFTQDELLEKAHGKYDGTKNHREGIVVRSTEEKHSEVLGGRMSFKVINNDYLLKEE